MFIKICILAHVLLIWVGKTHTHKTRLIWVVQKVQLILWKHALLSQSEWGQTHSTDMCVLYVKTHATDHYICVNCNVCWVRPCTASKSFHLWNNWQELKGRVNQLTSVVLWLLVRPNLVKRFRTLLDDMVATTAHNQHAKLHGRSLYPWHGGKWQL